MKSVLGPLLFISFINDLHKAVEFHSVRHFADDTKAAITKLLGSCQLPDPVVKVNNGKYLRAGRQDFDSADHSHLM